MSNQILFHNGVLDEMNGNWIQMGNKCRDCGKTSYPAMERCPFCASENTDKVPLENVGTVFSFSVTRVPVAAFRPPIVGAYVDLPEGTRVFGQIHASPETVRVGMKVRVETGVLWTEKDGTEVVGYYYVPADNEKGGDR